MGDGGAVGRGDAWGSSGNASAETAAVGEESSWHMQTSSLSFAIQRPSSYADET
jgi:hypothetical protein